MLNFKFAITLTTQVKKKNTTDSIKKGREIKKELIEETEKRKVKIKGGEKKSGRNRNNRIW